MSWQATAAMLGHKVGNATRKLVLLGYADHAADDGSRAWLTPETLAKYAECDPRTVQRHIAWLLQNGYMREGDQRHVAHYDPRRRPIVYDLAMTAAQVERWKVEYEPGRRAMFAEIGARSQAAKAERLAALDANVDAPVSGDILSPQETASGDILSPQDPSSRGDSGSRPGVTDDLSRGDSSVTLTTQEPPQEPPTSSSPVADAPVEAGQDLVLIGEVIEDPVDPFDEFWSVYPRKVGKEAARKAFTKATAKTPPDLVIAGARRFMFDPNLPGPDEKQFIAHPATWLNEGRWDDEPLPPRIRRAAAAEDRSRQNQDVLQRAMERAQAAEAGGQQ